MTAPMQPTQPERRAALTPPSSPEEHEALRGEWMNFFARPEVQAGLMQFGVGMLQPVGWGQSQRGNVGLALADAAGAAGRVNEQKVQDRDFATKQANEETRQDLENRRTGALERETASRTKIAADQQALDERQLNEYLIPSLKGRGGGGANPESTRNAMMKSLMTSALKAQAEAAALGEDFDMDAYIDSGVAAMDRMLGTGTPTTPPPASGGGAATPTGLPALSEVTDEDIIDVYANGTPEEQKQFETWYGADWIKRKNDLVTKKGVDANTSTNNTLASERAQLVEDLKTTESGILKQQIQDRIAEIDGQLNAAPSAY